MLDPIGRPLSLVHTCMSHYISCIFLSFLAFGMLLQSFPLHFRFLHPHASYRVHLLESPLSVRETSECGYKIALAR